MWKDIPADEGSLMMSSFHSPDRDTGPKRGWSCPKTELPVYMGGGECSQGCYRLGTQTQKGMALVPKMPSLLRISSL